MTGTLDRDELIRLAGRVGRWYATTHGNELDHDHHCPAARTKGADCECGWTDAEPALARLAEWAT